MKIGIRGAGFITTRIAETINKMSDEYELYALCLSPIEPIERGLELREKYGFNKVFTSFEEMLCDQELDLVYIAMTNQFHFQSLKECIEHGKAVLCEKPLCLNASEAETIVTLARERRVFVAEAIWPNYAPARWLIDDILKSGMIGDVVEVEVVMSNKVFVDHRPRIDSLEYGGGALMDFAAYTLGSMVMAHFGSGLKVISVHAEKAKSGVDIRDELVLGYETGPTVRIRHDSMKERPFIKYGRYFGTQGLVEVDGTSNITGIRVYDSSGDLVKKEDIPPMITGYEYEFMACKRCLEAKEIQPMEQPHDLSLSILKTTDDLRKEIGIRFPCDRAEGRSGRSV